MKAFRLTAIAVSISAALFALSAFTPPRQSDVIQIRSDALANSSAPRLLVMGCANECNELACVSLGAHLNQSGDANYGPGHACALYESTCPHPLCRVSARADSIAAVVAAVDPADDGVLATFLGVEGVEFNVSRSAFQFIGCNGEVVAQVSVRSSVAAKLNDHLAQIN